MSGANLAATAEVSSASVSADTMLKRVFGVANILAIVKREQDVEQQTAENRAKNQHPNELQYREEEQVTHTALHK